MPSMCPVQSARPCWRPRHAGSAKRRRRTGDRSRTAPASRGGTAASAAAIHVAAPHPACCPGRASAPSVRATEASARLQSSARAGGRRTQRPCGLSARRDLVPGRCAGWRGSRRGRTAASICAGSATVGVEVRRGGLGRKVHRGLDTRQPIERLFDARGARGAGHALESEFDATPERARRLGCALQR